MKTYNVSLIGFGGVNRALTELIASHNYTWKKDLGFQLKIVGVSDLNLGSIIAPQGIDPQVLASTQFNPGGFAELPGGSAQSRSLDVIRDAPADIVVEATFTDIKTGQPAINHCRESFAAGRSVVTSNKGPVALAAKELSALATEQGVGFEYEGAVMSGTPVIRLASQALAGVDILGFQGILNGTSNFIIGCLEAGVGFEQAVQEAKIKGYAEADPTADVEGYDVRLKVVILANELLGASLKPADINCSGISSLTAADIEEAAQAGERWKLIGAAQRLDNGTVAAQIGAQRLPLEHSLAAVSGATNAITFSTQHLGDITITGPGAGRTETAYALLSDIIALHRSQTISCSGEVLL